MITHHLCHLRPLTKLKWGIPAQHMIQTTTNQSPPPLQGPRPRLGQPPQQALPTPLPLAPQRLQSPRQSRPASPLRQGVMLHPSPPPLQGPRPRLGRPPQQALPTPPLLAPQRLQSPRQSQPASPLRRGVMHHQRQPQFSLRLLEPCLLQLCPQLGPSALLHTITRLLVLGPQPRATTSAIHYTTFPQWAPHRPAQQWAPRSL